MTDVGRLPYAYQDDTVHVQLRATAYRYGGGATDRGVQITLDNRHQGHTTAARMPRDVARLLALAILAEVDGDPGHVIDLRVDGWTIQHPLSCRPNLFACPVNRAAENDLTDCPSQAPGRYVCALDDAGRIEIGDISE